MGHPFLFVLPIDSHSLYWHCHAASAAAATRELVALEGDDALLLFVKSDLVVDHIGGSHYVEACVAEGLQRVLVASVADELAWLEAEEVAAAVPLLAGCPVVVAASA